MFTHSYHTLSAVKAKAQMLNENGELLKETRFSLDPQITTFEMLQSLLAKAFEISREFLIYYMATDSEGNPVQLSLLNDWDLDAAVTMNTSQSLLEILVKLLPLDLALEDWDVVTPADISTSKPNQKVKQDRLLDNLAERLSNVLGIKAKNCSVVKAPMSMAEFKNYMDSSGRFVNERAFRESVFNGGIHQSIRKEAWRVLLNIYPPDLTEEERSSYIKAKMEEYDNLKSKWKVVVESGQMSEEVRVVTSMIRKDVIRTDRTHAFFKGKEDNTRIQSLFDILCTYSLYHPEVSYCQGMSDMASVLLIVQSEERVAYILFCSLMQRLKHNFMFDGVAMQCKFDHLKLLLTYYDPNFWTYLIEAEVNDLFFSYRWLLLEMKREFPFDDALLMLEIMWSTIPSDPPLNGISLSELPRHSSNLFTSSPQTCRSCDVGTPTLYTKLKTLSRRSSNKSSSLVHENNPNQDSINSTHDHDIPAISENEQKVTETNGSDMWKDTVDQCLIEHSNSSRNDCNKLNNTFDTYTESYESDVPDLQFKLESSDNHDKYIPQQPLFPPPGEFGYGNPFLMFAALTMILEQKEHIMKNKLDFDSIVLLFDHSMRKNNVYKILHGAKILYSNYIREYQEYNGYTSVLHV